MELKDAFVLSEKVMNIVATGNDDVDKKMREYICKRLDISHDMLVEAWYKISRRDEDKKRCGKWKN
jgi:hypothetical protein